ncbi:DUF6030 family protein [Consotaella aegiceratis]|uniref:DUF6030 family protein n=1 Tax=Consotaella aegiceratis TaxID=3097961 RepID=UPI002F3EF40E
MASIMDEANSVTRTSTQRPAPHPGPSTTNRCAILIVMALAGASTAQPAAAQGGDQPQASPDIGTSVTGQDSPPSPAAPEPAPLLPNELLTPKRLGVPHWVRYPTATPEMLCDALQLGETELQWHRGNLPTGEWECLSELKLPPRSEDPDEASDDDALPADRTDSPTSIFAILRGRDAESVGEVRYKLNLHDPATTETAVEQLRQSLGRLFETLQWRLPPSLDRALHRLEPLDLDLHGTEIELRQEPDIVRRYNLLIHFPSPADRPRFDRRLEYSDTAAHASAKGRRLAPAVPEIETKRDEAPDDTESPAPLDP